MAKWLYSRRDWKITMNSKDIKAAGVAHFKLQSRNSPAHSRRHQRIP